MIEIDHISKKIRKSMKLEFIWPYEKKQVRNRKILTLPTKNSQIPKKSNSKKSRFIWIYLQIPTRFRNSRQNQKDSEKSRQFLPEQAESARLLKVTLDPE